MPIRPPPVADEAAQDALELGVEPGVAAGERGACGADVQHDVEIVEATVERILEGDELQVEREAGEGLEDAEVGVDLLVPEGVGDHVRLPAAQLTPGVEHADADRGALGQVAVAHLVDRAELVGDLLDAGHEVRELDGEREAAAVAAPVERLAGDRAAGPTARTRSPHRADRRRA